MKLTKSEIRVIYIALRILEQHLPYEEEIEEVFDKCRTLMSSDEILELEDEAYAIISNSDELKSLKESF
ncbi:MAG: hypothetical protein AB1546_13830 [bacterium]